ncbi:MAG TPA: ATP-binding protein [Actinomycetota bacterium]|nr:ATP-binding protein [Actinomycetota bacterium]
MSDKTSNRSARWARIVHVGSLVILALVLLAIVLGALAGEGGGDPLFVALVIVVVGGFSTLGRLIVTRAGNVLGWVFLVMGASLALGLPAEGYLDVAYQEPYVASLPGTEIAGLLASVFPALMAYSIPMLFLLFPTGSPPTPRWHWVIWVWLTGTILSGIWLLFRPGSVYSEPDRYSIPNPIGLEFLRPLEPLLLNAGVAIVLASAVAAVVSLVVRFRRARGEERQQITWLLLVAIVAALLMLTMFVVDLLGIEQNDVLWIALLMVLVLGIPGATALAIFRYRLYDVDVVVSKTIAYAGLGLGIAVAYGAIVIGLGALIGDESSEALRLGAAIVVAIAVQPAWSLFNRLANRIVYGGRATPYQVMAEFGDRITQIPSVDQLLPDMAEAAAKGVGARAARVRMFLPRPESADRVQSATWPSGAGVGEPDLTLPIEHAGEAIGDLSVVKSPGDPLRPTERTLLEDLAAHAGIGLENARLSVDLERRAEELSAQTEELRRSRERLVTVRDAQRHRLEQELRDGVGAEIASIRDEIRDDAERVVVYPDAVRSSLERLSERATEALDDLREVARGIFPPLLSDEGLAAALGALARRTGPGTQLSILGGSTDVRYDPAVEAAIYFCCVQALQNAQRHAPGRRVDLTLIHAAGEVSFAVRDRGAGFDVEHASGGEGLQIMRDRIAALGGSITIDSAPGAGTTVTGALPARALAVTT